MALAILLKPVFPVLDYIMNYDYISKVLCENKDKPKIHCNGKCHLMKELAKASEQEKPISSDKKIAIQEKEVLFFQDIKSLEIKHQFFQNNSFTVDSYTNLYFHLTSCSVFRPPTLA